MRKESCGCWIASLLLCAAITVEASAPLPQQPSLPQHENNNNNNDNIIAASPWTTTSSSASRLSTQQQQQQRRFSMLSPLSWVRFGFYKEKKKNDTRIPPVREQQRAPSSSVSSFVEKEEEGEGYGEGAAVDPSPRNNNSSMIGSNYDDIKGALWRRILTALAVPATSSPEASAAPIHNLPWARWGVDGLRFGILFLVARAVWKAVAEVADEFAESIMLDNDNDDGDYNRLRQRDRAFDAEQVKRVVEFLAVAAASTASTEGGGEDQVGTNLSSLRPADTKSLPAMHLAQKLQTMLPLQRHGHNDNDSTTVRTVESVLLSLTKAEAAILSQCLLSTPPSSQSQGMAASTLVIPQSAKAMELRIRQSPAWRGILGLDEAKQCLLSALDMVIQEPADGLGKQNRHRYAHLFDDATTSFTSTASAMVGCLVYGPPGCGKSFLIRALASATQLPCLVVTPSLLMRKYFGETNRKCRDLFSLVDKLSPCILSIDEIDGLFRERNDDEHDALRELKTEFMQHLDGLLSSSSSNQRRRNLIVAATNRPFDVDPSILRRLAQTQFVGFPTASTRAALLRVWLLSSDCESGENQPSSGSAECLIDIDEIARRTEFYTPSDLRRLLQTAATMGPIQDHRLQPPNSREIMRPLTTEDILRAMRFVPPTPLSQSYRRALVGFRRAQSSRRDLPGTNSLFDESSGSDKGYEQARHPRSDKWITPDGHFYSIGCLRLDHDAFTYLTQVAQDMKERLDEDASQSQDEEFDDEDDDNDFF